jgi:hypothetical protein
MSDEINPRNCSLTFLPGPLSQTVSRDGPEDDSEYGADDSDEHGDPNGATD